MTQLDSPRERLWQWLVEHAGATTDDIEGDLAGVRLTVVQEIHYQAQTSSDTDQKRAGAVAGALLDLGLVATDHATAKWYLELRAKVLDKAGEAMRAVAVLRQSWRDLEERAKADRPNIPPMVPYWPEAIARDLAARDVALAGAEAFILDYGEAVEKLGENVWGAASDLLPTVGRIALHLADAGFTAAEIADLLDETTDSAELKYDRWRKRVEWARKSIGRGTETRRSAHGTPISDADGGGPPQDEVHAACDTTPRSAPPPNRRSARRRG